MLEEGYERMADTPFNVEQHQILDATAQGQNAPEGILIVGCQNPEVLYMPSVKLGRFYNRRWLWMNQILIEIDNSEKSWFHIELDQSYMMNNN